VLLLNPGPVTLTLFRISTMGDITSADIDRLLQCFAQLPR
jgi:aspartate aminotransferase-like enzyme